MIIRILETENKDLIGTIWNIEDDTAICVDPKNTKYTVAQKIKIEELGYYTSEKYELLLD